MQVGGVRLRSQHGKVESLNDQISAVQKRLAKLVAEKSTKEKNLLKSATSIEKKTRELEAIDVELLELEERFQSACKETIKVKQEIQTLSDVNLYLIVGY